MMSVTFQLCRIGLLANVQKPKPVNTNLGPSQTLKNYTIETIKGGTVVRIVMYTMHPA